MEPRNDWHIVDLMNAAPRTKRGASIGDLALRVCLLTAVQGHTTLSGHVIQFGRDALLLISRQHIGSNMKSFRGPKAAIGAALLAAGMLSGCVVAPAPGYYYGGAVVRVAPPAPTVEVVGVAPAPGYVWMGGYWNWVGAQHVWVGGHWGPGRPGYYWVPHRWVQARGGWRMAPGHWAR